MAVQRANKMDCLGFYEMSCAGICHSEERLVGLYQDCVLNLGSPGAAGTLLQSAATMNNRARCQPPVLWSAPWTQCQAEHPPNGSFRPALPVLAQMV